MKPRGRMATKAQIEDEVRVLRLLFPEAEFCLVVTHEFERPWPTKPMNISIGTDGLDKLGYEQAIELAQAFTWLRTAYKNVGWHSPIWMFDEVKP